MPSPAVCELEDSPVVAPGGDVLDASPVVAFGGWLVPTRAPVDVSPVSDLNLASYTVSILSMDSESAPYLAEMNLSKFLKNYPFT